MSLVRLARSVACCTLLSLGSTLAAPASRAPLSAAQQAQVQRIANSVRCPICRDVLPITESGNAISQQMVSEIGEQVRAGNSDAEVYAYFRARYGDGVLLRPPKNAAGRLLWAVPALTLLLGGAWLVQYLHQKPPGPVTAGSDPALNAELPEDPYLAEVRAEVEQRAGRKS